MLGCNVELVETLGAEFADGATCVDAFFGNFAGGLVADDGSEAGDHREGVLYQRLAAFLVGDDSLHAFLVEDGGDVG